MSQYPPGYPPQYPPQYPSLPYGRSPTSPRPQALTVLAIIGIVLGSLGLLCNTCGAIGAVAGSAIESWPGMAQQGANNPMDEVMRQPTYKAWSLISSVIGLVICAVLLIGSIGALSLKSWALPSLTGYCVAGIIMGAITLIVTLALILPALNRTGSSDPERLGGVIGGVIGAGCVSVLLTVYPIILLVYLRRPEIIALFKRGGDASYPPPPYP